MTNFSYLTEIPAFKPFAEIAVSAEKVYPIDAASSAINSRRALEFAVRFVYSVDTSLPEPWQDNLGTLIHVDEFRKLIGENLYRRINYIRILGNNAAHNTKKITPEQAALSLENLFIFFDFLACCYAPEYKKHVFNADLLGKNAEDLNPAETNKEAETLKQLMAQNAILVEELTRRRKERSPFYEEDPLALSEFKTRKLYIDVDLESAGWVRGSDWIEEYELSGMPNASGVGYADYVLFGDDGRPLAVLEAKKTCKEVAVGRQQAKLYADLLEKKFGQRPVIFLSNGFETRIWQGTVYPERRVSSVYSKRDLEKEFNKLRRKTPLSCVEIRDEISGRYYQKEAIKAVCESFDKGNRRKALLVMATGSGKTRTVISLVDVLLRHNWVKNILFLADRTQLVRQAKRAFTNLLPDLSLTNLSESNPNLGARAVFSTYQTMQGAIDTIRDENGGRLFTCGHFDLIIADEAHRSIYNKYRDIFNYFDAHLVGLTATPKEDIDKNTYEVFELENGVPTYGYDLKQAVSDGYLVDFSTIESKLRFLSEGISYADLSDEEKEEYEKYFTDEDGNVPEKINASALNKWLFNTDTIRKVIHTVMKHTQYIEYGSKIGKTIIFAANHKHAERIYEEFGREYPNYPPNYCRVIDNYANYADSLIDEFSSPDKLPQIAISVDMLDTGIDIPEVLNLVFFKKVFSKAKFWQMIGRGTRLCPKLLDGEDKKQFYIFDFCGNFEFFKISANGKRAEVNVSLQERLFRVKAELIYKLQGICAQSEELTQFRTALIEELCSKVNELNRESYVVRQHLKYVELYSQKKTYDALSYARVLEMAEHVAPLLPPADDEASAVYFDYLVFETELACVSANSRKQFQKQIVSRVKRLSDFASIPEVKEKLPLIQQILSTDYLSSAGIPEFEVIRNELRGIMKYLPFERQDPVYTHFEDDISDPVWGTGEPAGDYLKTYREKAEHYLRGHAENPAVVKLKSNVPLDDADIRELERILWKEIGTRSDYQKEVGDVPLGVFVRRIVGLDVTAAKAAFSRYLSDEHMSSQQIYFVNKIVEYVVKTGLLTDRSVFLHAPFTDRGSVSDLFDPGTLNGILSVIERINRNAGLKGAET